MIKSEKCQLIVFRSFFQKTVFDEVRKKDILWSWWEINKDELNLDSFFS